MRPSSSSRAAGGRARSALLKTTMAGIFRSRSSQRMPSSNWPQSPDAAMTRPRSVRSNTCRVFCIRSSPSAPSSSMPAVSMNSTGPMGSISIGFSTGSVVVPAICETIETCCLVSALSNDDLPALRRPNRPMWRRKDFGVGCIRLGQDGLFMAQPPHFETHHTNPKRKRGQRPKGFSRFRQPYKQNWWACDSLRLAGPTPQFRATHAGRPDAAGRAEAPREWRSALPQPGTTAENPCPGCRSGNRSGRRGCPGWHE